MKKRIPTLAVFFMLLATACSPGGLQEVNGEPVPADQSAPTLVSNTDQVAADESDVPRQATEPVSIDSGLLVEFGFSRAPAFSLIPPPDYKPVSKTSLGPNLPVDVDQVANPSVTDGLLDAQKQALWRDGFTVVETNEEQFSDIRRRVSTNHGQPYFLTTDAAFHAVHLTFDELLKAIEKEHFAPLMKQITAQTLETVSRYREQTKDSSIEEDAALAEEFLAVGLKLFDPETKLDPQVEAAIQAQLRQIQAENGREISALIPEFEDDYSAYRPVGHYAGDPALENYFRGMTWFGRVQFQLVSTKPTFKPSRAPLLITLALREKDGNEEAPAASWGAMHEVLSMMIGPLDDGSPLEYAALMDRIYGKGHTLADLKDEFLWQDFIASQSALPAPQINSTFANSLADLEMEHGWRFSGQRFTMDAFFLQNLVYDRVGTRENPRKLPSGLDVMAILGSAPADQILEETGETNYAHYPEQQAAMKSWTRGQMEDNWWNTFYSSWLYAFTAQVQEKSDAFPPFMRTPAWGIKDLTSALGSWAELKHDTALYTKMPEFAGGGGPPSSGPAPAFVEPNPQVFYRMAYALWNLADGLEMRGMNVSLEPSQPGDFAYSNGIEGLIGRTATFGERLQMLGDIAARELAGQSLTVEDYEVIQGCLGPVECQVLMMQDYFAHGIGAEQEMPPVPVVAAVAGAEENLLEVGVGHVNRIYVVVPLEGGLQIAQGGVFSYYEFTKPRSERLTDQGWREELAGGEVKRPSWTDGFLTSGGEVTDILAMHIGDWFIITPAGDDLNVRDKPGKQGAVKGKLYMGEYIEVVDGPENVNGSRWWKIRYEFQNPPLEGWVLEDLTWYERAYGQ